MTQITHRKSYVPKQVSITNPTGQVNVDGVRQLRSLTNVNSSSLVYGALIQYDATSDKFITRNELETTSGTLTFNGGNF